MELRPNLWGIAMWKRLADPNKEDKAFLRSVKKGKIFADEDIEEEAVEWIRSRGVNIKSARELGHRGKPDSFLSLKWNATRKSGSPQDARTRNNDNDVGTQCGYK
jgi:hypothetical protein